MKQTLQVLNQLEADGVLGRYAIGGAMGATFFVEPLLTYDLDIFVLLPETASLLKTARGGANVLMDTEAVFA